MKSAKEYLESEVKRLVEQAREVTRKAEEENRGLTDEERMKVEGLISETNTLKSRITEQDDNERLLDAIKDVSQVGDAAPSTAPEKARTIGERFAKSEAYQALRKRGLSGNWNTGPVEIGGFKLTDSGLVVVSESGTGTGIFAADADTNINPTVLPGVQSPIEQRLTVADLLGAGTTATNSVVYLRETTPSGNSAGVTSEGAAKPASEIDFEKQTASVEKIATFLPISDEMLEDEPQVVSYINGRLAVFVKQAEEAYLVDAILNVAKSASSAGEIDGDGLFDGIAAAIMHVRQDAQLEPDALLVTAADAARMDTAKASTSGTYFSGGPYGAPNQNPWGLRRVITNVVTDGSPLVGAFRDGATVWRRGGLSVAASNSHADYFRKNLTALRAEERLALTVFREDAFQVVDPTS